MAIDKEYILSAAMSCAVYGYSFQSSLREYIADQVKGHGPAAIADNIAELTSEYRNSMEGWINDDDGEQALRRKKVNNICNDISRMSRELLGHSIVCKSKKGGEYTYVPKVPAARSSTEPMDLPELTPSISQAAYDAAILKVKEYETSIKYLEGIIQENLKVITYLRTKVNNEPKELLEEMVEVHGTEYTGRLMIQVLNDSD